MSELLYKDLVYKTIGCAMEVHNKLGFGFLEKVYENALMLELQNSGIMAFQQYTIEVFYKNTVVGNYIADIVVDNKIIIELKSTSNINDAHVAQTLNYLKATGFELGLLINFAKDELEYKRLVFQPNRNNCL